MGEKCAVVGVFGVENAAKVSYLCLYAMQHRGQEATGISSSDGKHIFTIKDRGLVSQVYNRQDRLSKLNGNMSIGHNRYSTAGDDSILDAQPIFARYDLGEISIVHNGNLTNTKSVKDKLTTEGAIFQSNMDTENLIHLIARSSKSNLKGRILDALAQIQGAYCLIFLSRKKMFIARDPHGFRPLSIGKLGDGYVVASETCALALVGATYVRDVEPGELIVFDDKGLSSTIFAQKDPKFCIFEHVYFARPDSFLFGESSYEVRKKMGAYLAKCDNVKADMVVPVPDSSIPHAIGYSQESQIPFELAIIRNHYVGRTFIEPFAEVRNLKVKKKLSPIKELINGKKLIVIDDSIVRGTTSKKIVSLLRENGAKEVHMRIASPPVKYACFYGVDTPDTNELAASKYSIDEIASRLGVDSLAYLDISDLKKSVFNCNDFCTACFDGNYFHEIND